jgi:glycosyltransferase involved in cell wall biosynthesis
LILPDVIPMNPDPSLSPTPVFRLLSPQKGSVMRNWLAKLFGKEEPPVEQDSDILSIFHDFAPPPSGGGHQFMRALEAELKSRGVRTENNTLSRSTSACLFNSFNFNFKKLRSQRHRQCRMVHRVDGPVSVYRGMDDGTDNRIAKINKELADASIFQSRFSLAKHRELGFDFANPCVVMNAANPQIFYRADPSSFNADRKIRLISTSWSDNPNKGADAYQWLDQNLDWTRYDYVFIGRLPVPMKNIKVIAPVASETLADHLRQSDIFITASRNDPCSNSLIEALSCGLPALYLNSGGHPEITGQGGLPFENPEEIPPALDRLIQSYSDYRDAIVVPTIQDVALRYLTVLGFQSTTLPGQVP